jgi:hypothetical protein
MAATGTALFAARAKRGGTAFERLGANTKRAPRAARITVTGSVRIGLDIAFASE